MSYELRDTIDRLEREELIKHWEARAAEAALKFLADVATELDLDDGATPADVLAAISRLKARATVVHQDNVGQFQDALSRAVAHWENDAKAVREDLAKALVQRDEALRERDLLMLDPANRLDGYRELGGLVAAARNELDDVRLQLAESHRRGTTLEMERDRANELTRRAEARCAEFIAERDEAQEKIERLEAELTDAIDIAPLYHRACQVWDAVGEALLGPVPPTSGEPMPHALEDMLAAIRRLHTERDEARQEIVVLMENTLRALEAPVDHAWLSDAKESVVEEARLMVAHRDGALRERDEARRVAVRMYRECQVALRSTPALADCVDLARMWGVEVEP